MKQRIAVVAVGVLALAGLGAAAHYSSTRASQAAAVSAPATPVSGTHFDTVAPAAAPGTAVVPAPTNASTVDPASGAPVATAVAATPGDRVVYRDRVVSRTRAARRSRYYVHERSKKHAVEIIGGSTLGGAGLGALVGGKKGALIGGLVGGAAGTVYERKTHKKVVRE
jgi:hypothetical protein